MLEHRATAIHRIVVATPSPIRVDLPKLATSAALFDVEVVTLIIGVHGTSTSVAPEDGEAGSIQMQVERLPALLSARDHDFSTQPPLPARRQLFVPESSDPPGPPLDRCPRRGSGGKLVHAWAFEGDCDPSSISCNTVTIEWPPRSGRHEAFPEVDRAGFFGLDEARRKVNAGQVPLIDEL